MKLIFTTFLLASLGLALADPVVPLSVEQARLLQLSHASDDFGIHLLQTLENDAPGKNVFVSGFSVSTALAMLIPGGVGNTYSEIYNSLGFAASRFSNEDIMHGYQRMINELNHPSVVTGNVLSVANAVAVQKDKPIFESFLSNITTYFGSHVFVEDFAKEAEKATSEINQWASEQTHGKIAKLFDSKLERATTMVLLNAIYFKGIWDHKFEVKSTNNEVFHVTSAQQETVPLMVTNQHFHYGHFEDGQLVEIPYKNQTMSMFVFLPNENQNLKISSVLNVESLEQRIAKLHSTDVVLHLPKFKFEGSYMLHEPLVKMGISTAFTRSADFSQIDGHKDLYVSEVVHKTFVDVNEEGSEAAAVTAIKIHTMSKSAPQQRHPVQMIVNRPFMFFIRDNQHHLTLFSGVIHKPEYKH